MSLFDNVSRNAGSGRAAQGSGGASSSGATRILTSQWGSLSDHLLAKFYPVRRMESGTGWEQSSGQNALTDTYTVDDGVEVWAPISDGHSELTASWHSPFEGAGAEGKTISSMLQSGAATSFAQALSGLGLIKENFGDVGQRAVDFLRDIEGRTSITKLNSTQVFQGMPPLKITLTAHFRALMDPVSEVRAPLQQLREWAVPQVLAADGLLANAVSSSGGSKSGVARKVIETLYPSKTPQLIGMKYGDMLLQPLCIESISETFTNPRSDKGVMVSSSVQITLSTITALDRRDIQAIHAGR
jgi:hypothetical protein